MKMLQDVSDFEWFSYQNAYGQTLWATLALHCWKRIWISSHIQK